VRRESRAHLPAASAASPNSATPPSAPPPLWLLVPEPAALTLSVCEVSGELPAALEQLSEYV
jgi:hypothetical protein